MTIKIVVHNKKNSIQRQQLFNQFIIVTTVAITVVMIAL